MWISIVLMSNKQTIQSNMHNHVDTKVTSTKIVLRHFPSNVIVIIPDTEVGQNVWWYWIYRANHFASMSISKNKEKKVVISNLLNLLRRRWTSQLKWWQNDKLSLYVKNNIACLKTHPSIYEYKSSNSRSCLATYQNYSASLSVWD